MSHRALGPMFHGTSEYWAAHIVNNGQRSNMSPLGTYGRGLYLTPDLHEAHNYARGRNHEPAVVEGHLPDANVYDITPEDREHLDQIYKEHAPKNDGSYRRAMNDFTSGIARDHNVIRIPSTGFHVAIRPNVFLPTKVHFPDETVDLR